MTDIPEYVPKGHGLMIIAHGTALVMGEPGRVHQEFMYQVRTIGDNHRKEGSPNSGGWRGMQSDL